jgi:molecular chaperone GrpE
VDRPFLNWVDRFVKLKTVDTPKPDSNISDVSSDANLPSETLEGQLAAIVAERDRLAAEKADLADRLLRARAEFDNARRRAERERSEFLQFAAMDLVKDVLPVLDDFERALKVETAGRPFDPNLHQAVERVETDEAEDHTVIGEFQRGYNFKGKLLRPAMVRVAVKP